MGNMSIGLSGLMVAQQAIEIISTNIANAGTDGYHRQTPVISAMSTQGHANPSTGGAEITTVRRNMDGLLESEILRNQPLQGQVAQELMTLEAIESSLGSLGSQGLTTALTQFFNDLRELAVQPQSGAFQQQAVWSADALAGQFSNLGSFLVETTNSLKSEAQDLVRQANLLTGQIAELNSQILAGASRGDSSNLLMDQRDEALRQLADIIPIQTNAMTDIGTRDVRTESAGLVIGAHATEMALGIDADQRIGMTLKDASLVDTQVSGGRLGAVINLQNNVVAQMTEQLDALANQVMSSINRLHVQGVGSAGAFEELIGSSGMSETITDWPQQVEAGSFHVRVTDTTTGETTRYEIAVDPAEDTLSDVAGRLAAVPGLATFTANGQLRIQAESGCEFDFRPGVEPAPTSSTLTGTSIPSISGNYSDTDNATYSFTVEGTGQVGLTADLKLSVRDGDGVLVNSLNVGSGYPAGTRLSVADGIYVALPTGTLTNGEQFTVEALGQSDTTGFLAAAGINTLFAGNSALSMRVKTDVLGDASLLAVSTSKEGGDNLNVLAMADVENLKAQSLGQMTPPENLQFFISSLGQRVDLARSRQVSTEQVMLQLENQRDTVSGVDINEQAAQLMIFERLFQACSQVLSSQDQSLEYLMDLL